ncbi:hypothetical protein GCM10023158_33790 [Gluconacetobacter tumulicola]
MFPTAFSVAIGGADCMVRGMVNAITMTAGLSGAKALLVSHARDRAALLLRLRLICP